MTDFANRKYQNYHVTQSKWSLQKNKKIKIIMCSNLENIKFDPKE